MKKILFTSVLLLAFGTTHFAFAYSYRDDSVPNQQFVMANPAPTNKKEPSPNNEQRTTQEHSQQQTNNYSNYQSNSASSQGNRTHSDGNWHYRPRNSQPTQPNQSQPSLFKPRSNNYQRNNPYQRNPSNEYQTPNKSDSQQQSQNHTEQYSQQPLPNNQTNNNRRAYQQPNNHNEPRYESPRAARVQPEQTHYPESSMTNSHEQYTANSHGQNQERTNNSSEFNAKEKAQWFKSCMAAVTSKNLQSSAQRFCTCGWDKIAGGALTPQLLVSKNPADIRRANSILEQISQECLLETVSRR